MIIDTLTLSLTLGLSNFLMAAILTILHRKEEILKGVDWWVLGITLLGFHFVTLFLENLFAPTLLSKITMNALLVGSSLFIYLGLVRFFNHFKPGKYFAIFSITYIATTVLLVIIEYPVILSAISTLSVGIFSALSARILFNNPAPDLKKYPQFLSLVFAIHAAFFLIQSVLFFISDSAISGQLALFIENLTFFAAFVSSILWTFGFVFLINQRQIKNSGEAKKIFNHTISTIPDAVMITRLRDGQILKVNQGFISLTGYSAEDVVGKTTLDISLWDDQDERQKFLILLTSTGSVENMEFHFKKNNDKVLIALVSAQMINIDEETHILSVVRDITSRKKMEEKLRENEEKYRFLAEYSGDVIWHINRSYRIDFISTADETIRGFKREEVIGQSIWNIFKPEGVKLVREKIEHHRQVEQVGNNMNVTRFEIEQRTKDGQWIWTDITAAPHYNKYGKLVGYHGISRDISERKRLLEELNRQATTDELCQIPNRRHFMVLAERELKRSKRYHHKLSICLIDFDNLKAINDSYGHMAGDRALSVFSKMVRTLIRDVDIIGRFGGDEFLVLLPETDEQQAYLVIERIRQVLATSPIVFQDEAYKISISSGITGINEWTDTLDDLLNRADEALYKAKQAGGNCIVSLDDQFINISAHTD